MHLVIFYWISECWCCLTPLAWLEPTKKISVVGGGWVLKATLVFSFRPNWNLFLDLDQAEQNLIKIGDYGNYVLHLLCICGPKILPCSHWPILFACIYPGSQKIMFKIFIMLCLYWGLMSTPLSVLFIQHWVIFMLACLGLRSKHLMQKNVWGFVRIVICFLFKNDI